jgi:hypothetical protein
VFPGQAGDGGQQRIVDEPITTTTKGEGTCSRKL